ncbi:protein disulfide-isomerase like 2-1-like [Papaver somniferum]|uniref:protein disulfide-isomerase like 2-1-like n=1 Tax=Papaver somniferum TaxID=3469 RepID=UPI000E6F59E8|nr:protein disulfide-isomerase like 2-1-like [Papaver somniferum]
MVSSEKKKIRLNLSIEISGLLLLILVSSSVADVVVLNDNNFEKNVGQDRYAFINFYYPGFLTCERLDPQYENLGENIKMANESVLIGKVDCEKNWSICKKYEITVWPTLKWFYKGSLKPKEYEGQWHVQFLSDFANTEAETNLKIETVPSNLVVLTDSNFDETKNVMAVFYASWSVISKALLLASTLYYEIPLSIFKAIKKEIGAELTRLRVKI